MMIQVTGMEGVERVLLRLRNIDVIVKNWFDSDAHDEIMSESFSKNFSDEGRPEKWGQLSPDTVSARERLGFTGPHPILVRTGNFMDEVTNMRSNRKFSPGISTAYWGDGELRSDEAEKLRYHTKGTRKMPKRPVLMFQEEDVTKLKGSLSTFIISQFK